MHELVPNFTEKPRHSKIRRAALFIAQALLLRTRDFGKAIGYKEMPGDANRTLRTEQVALQHIEVSRTNHEL